MATLIFGGAQIKRPGSYSVVDTSAMTVTSTGSFRVLAFIGVAPNLKEGTDVSQVLFFNSQTTKDAGDILGDGDLLRHIKKAWQHGADLVAVSVLVPATLGAPTDAEWQTAIDRLEKTGQVTVNGIVPLATSGAVIAKVDTHIQAMSSTLNRKERRGFYGHAKGTDIAAVKTLQASAGNSRAQFATPAPYDFAPDGSKVLYDATLMAAAFAGLWAGKEPQDPITYDYVQFAGLEKEYSATEIGDLLESGIAPVEITSDGFRIVQGRTADASTDDVSEQELSVATLKDVMSKDLRDYLEKKHVGKAGVAGIETTVYNDAVSRIKYYKDDMKWISDYVTDSIKVVKNGTAFSVDWEGSPTLPVNNFLITSHFKL